MCIPQPAAPVVNWQPAALPQQWQVLNGDHVSIEALDVAHAEELFLAYTQQGGEKGWQYLPYGPFSAQDFTQWLAECAHESDPKFVTIRDLRTGCAAGMASFLRIKPEVGVIEIGHIHFSPRLKGTVAASEAMFLMMQWVFTHGYRRLEWKCDALNKASRHAAQRLGFSYEGTFYQATITKNLNRDTAWFAMLDWQWPVLEDAFGCWLKAENFDAEGKQKTSLRFYTRKLLYALDPGYSPLTLAALQKENHNIVQGEKGREQRDDLPLR